MANVTLQIQISAELKKQADTLFAELGLSTSDAIGLFLEQAVHVGGLPFQPAGQHPNVDTREAMTELEQGGGERFQTTAELFGQW